MILQKDLSIYGTGFAYMVRTANKSKLRKKFELLSTNIVIQIDFHLWKFLLN